MTQFTQSFGFVITFLIGSLLVGMFAGEKVLTGFLILVLMGMLVTNADKFTNLLGRVSHV